MFLCGRVLAHERLISNLKEEEQQEEDSHLIILYDQPSGVLQDCSQCCTLRTFIQSRVGRCSEYKGVGLPVAVPIVPIRAIVLYRSQSKPPRLHPSAGGELPGSLSLMMPIAMDARSDEDAHDAPCFMHHSPL